MISGGVCTLFVSDMDSMVDFYSGILGLSLMYRAGNHWASIDAGKGFTIGLHSASEHNPIPGSVGAVQIGLNLDQPIEKAVSSLRERGIQFGGEILNDVEGGVKLAFFSDPEGNQLYLCESESH